MNDEQIEFKGVIDRLIGSYNNNFKIYAVTPTTNNKEIKYNKYGNVSISGDLPELTLGIEYSIKGIENKWGYEVINIERDKPTTKTAIKKFLKEIITVKQAETLLFVYPDIIDKIINDDLDDVDLNKTKGIKEKTFDSVKRKVIESFPLMNFVNEFSDYGVTLSEAKKMYKEFTSVDRMKEMMAIDPYGTLCLISGISFKKADKKILSAFSDSNLKNSLHRMRACIKFLLSENEKKGNTWISLDNLFQQCNNLCQESVNDYFVNALQDKDIYVEGSSKRIAFTNSYQTEKYIAECLITLYKSSQRLLIDYSKYYKNNGMDLTKEQQGVLKNFCEYNISLLVGNAGSGKSATIASIINLCDDNDLEYILMTPTGKSAMVLSEFTNRDAGTIHRKLEYNPKKGWICNKENKLRCDVVIVDENGMTDISLMKHLLDAIDLKRTRVLFVQDDAQLPSVSCGNCAYDMINSGILPITRLTKVFRYGEGGLLQVATKIRNGEKYIDNKQCDDIVTFGIHKDYCIIPTQNEYMMDYIIGIYKNLLKEGNDPLDIMVLSAKNINDNGAIEINQRIQEEINPHTENKHYRKYGDKIFREGDIVMQIKNNYQAINEDFDEVIITNGDIGQIKKIDGKYVYVQYKKDMITYAQDNLDEIQLAYAMTVHKSQGSGVKNVILATPTSHKFNLNKNLLYVGVTRAKEKVWHITLPETINSALRKSAELQRNTFLKDLLIKIN
ncbi:exodeoxyribonuclease V subunit alpha [Clostridium botulinum]|uniref:AAA family ATPase n=1 Tax=Clostridium botulinum TaxID=1491 RepID=UPI0009927DD8|nr:AAA family ATPase [Clostridium botulinum]NFO98312.1 exodeoxyribonuclease V subunit alpha [Clostridium botulinum]OOV52398.1 exodeoxyribonuclease V subunit alpha [Clostridium botulinum D/C]OOV55732.1 exodeoxyribonuclease V subunit alpha [Clostridium botulinum D/C]OOV57179.1 exodeoxyribonuclease V subunit alpha [Clostridium botulinum D/C]